VGVIPILTAEQMRNIDRRTTAEFGIPSIVLMENAAVAVTDAIAERFPGVERAAIFCGPGANGGDGLAIARHLEQRGVVAKIILLGERDRYRDDAATNLSICERLNLPLMAVTTADSLDDALATASECDLVVDAIFGTGLNRAPQGIYADAIRAFQSLRLPIVSVDVPSGVNATTATLFDPAVQADLTVTFAAPKLAHVASTQGEVAVDVILGEDAKMDYDVVPNVVYTHPELATVGLTEAQAKEKYPDAKASRFSFKASGRALALGESDGVMKLVTAGPHGRILGAHVVGPNASELIAEATLAMRLEATTDDVIATIHAHPTLAETFREAALVAAGTAIHTSGR